MACVPAAGAPAVSAPVPGASAPDTPAATQSPAPAEKPPGPIPVGEILKRAEEATAFVRALDAKLPPDASISRIEAQLPAVSERIAQRFERTQQTLESRPALG